MQSLIAFSRGAVASITIRNLDEQTKERLRIQGDAAGHEADQKGDRQRDAEPGNGLPARRRNGAEFLLQRLLRAR